MTPLERLAPGQFPNAKQWEARLAICRAVHGRGEFAGPAWRVGSNARLATSQPDSFGCDEPCQDCGAPGEDIIGTGIGGVGVEYCPACGNDWIVGDYDWRNLADCVRYRADLAAGLVAE